MKRWFLLLGVVILFGTIIGWRWTQKKGKEAADKKASAAQKNAPVLVETAAVSRQDIVKTFEAIANVESPVAVDISPELSGRITYLQVREGDLVKAGDVLVRIDPADLTSTLRRNQAALAEAQARYEQAKLTQNAQSVGVNSALQLQRSTLQSNEALDRKARADYEEQIAAAQANVTAAEGRVSQAESEIARVDSDIASAEASVENGRGILARQEALLAKGFVAQQIVDNARTQLRVQEAEVARAKQAKQSAIAARDAAVASRKSLERQVQLVQNKAKAEVAAAASAVTQAKATLSSAQANLAQTSAYTQNLAALQASVTAAAADVRAAESRLKDATIRSPLTGVVIRRAVDPGALASVGQPILSLQEVQQVWAVVSLPEEVRRRLSQGQAAKVRFDALPDETFNGQIAQILPSADPQSRQFTARVRLENRANRIKPGTFGRVTFVTEKEPNALTVPLEAVKRDPEKPDTASITVVAGDKAQVRTVRTGLDNGKMIALKEGVNEGDQVIILTSRPVKDGQPVKAGGDKKQANAKPDARPDAKTTANAGGSTR